MSRTINITQNGITRTINVATGVGPQGPQGESGVSNWSEIEDRPSTFTPAAHKASHATGGADALTPGDIGAATSDHTHTNAQVNTAIATDPGATRAVMIPHDYIYGADYGIISGNSADAVAEANALALQTAMTASSYLSKTLRLQGDIHIKGACVVTGSGVRVLGRARIIQKDPVHNGLTLNPTPVAAFDCMLVGISIVGQGAASHAAAGLFGQAAGLEYLTSDLKLVDCRIEGFRTGINIAGVAKFRTENLTIIGCRVGQELNHLQTSLQTNLRIVQGDGNAASACFKLTGGNFFADEIIGGEFGGSGIAKFADVTSGRLHVTGANLEAFSGQAIIDKPGLGSFALRLINSRISVAFGDTGRAIVSCQVNANAGKPIVEIVNIHGWSGVPRILEIYGANVTAGGAATIGGPVPVTFAATQGGTEIRSVLIAPGRQDYSDVASFPISGAVQGLELAYSAPLGNSDAWAAPNPLHRFLNQHSGIRQWSSTLNDVLSRVLGAGGRTASGNNVETDIHNVTLPIGVLANNGETVDIEAFGSTANNTNNKHFRFYFGGSLYLDFGALPIQNQSWTIKIRIQRGSFGGGTGFMKLVGTLDYGSGRVIRTAETPNATIDSTATIAARISVLTPTAASDAVSLASKAVWTRATSNL